MLRSLFEFPITRSLPAFLAAALLGMIGARPAVAAQFDVTSAANSGPGSLRQALLDAAAAPGDDDVVLQPNLGTITVSSELLWTASLPPNAVTIEGSGLRVDFNGAPRGFVDNGGKGVTIRNLEIINVGGAPNTTNTEAVILGSVVTIGDAAPVVSQGGSVVIEHCTIFDNHLTTPDGDVAGAVLSEGGPVTISDSTFFDNDATTNNGDAGAAVLSEGGPLTITNSTIRNNTADGPSDVGTVLSEGGDLNVSTSIIERNTVEAGGNAGGGLESEGGAVTVTNTTINCNRATAGSDSDAAGGLLSEGGTVNVTGSTFVGNVGITSGEGTSGSGIVSNGSEPVLTSTTINEDTSSCGGAIESFFLPKRVKVTLNTNDASKSRLVAAGFFDVGPELADLSSPASLDVGGFHFDAPSLTARRKAFILESGGTQLTITPKGFGSSRAKFKLITVGDFTGKIDPDGQLNLHFTNPTVDAGGLVKLTDGKYTLGKIRGALIAPNLYLARARATLKEAGKDSLAIVVGLATGGTTPADASDVTIGFGNNLSVTIPAASFTKAGDRFLFKGPPGSITKVVLDYARERITVFGKELDLGQFVEGGNRVAVSIAVGTDARAVVVRMVRKGSTMKY